MLDLRLPNRVLKFFIIVSALLLSPASWSQLGTGAEIDLDESTIRYPASWFTQYSPVSVNDMLSRIPGISSALRGRGGNRRGLGAGQNEILINGKRMAGKENRGKSQLSRIAASQLDYIEIIRGTSGDLNVRSGGLVVNIVLRASPSRSSVSAEVNMDHYADGTISPGGSISLTGQRGELNYLFSLEAEPRYNIGYRDETSYNPDYSLREIIDQEYTQDKTEYQGSMSLGYQFETSSVQFNALYAGADPNSETNRLITDYSTTPASVNVQREFTDREQSNWEIGGNYEYEFANRGSYKFLFIVNDETRLSTRERFKVEGSSEI